MPNTRKNHVPFLKNDRFRKREKVRDDSIESLETAGTLSLFFYVYIFRKNREKS